MTTFKNYSELDRWYQRNKRCVICNNKPKIGKMSCGEHVAAWAAKPESGTTQYVKWVNAERLLLGTCGGCNGFAQKDDYLCSDCRENI